MQLALLQVPQPTIGTCAVLIVRGAGRYRRSKTGQQLMAEFQASHLSVNRPGPQQLALPLLRARQQQQQQPSGSETPPADALRSTAAAGTAKRAGMEQDQDQDQEQPRQRIKREDDAKISIFLMSQSGHKVQVWVRPSTLVGKLMDAYHTVFDQPRNDEPGFKMFVFDGARMQPDCPLSVYRLEDGDTINVFGEQLGD